MCSRDSFVFTDDELLVLLISSFIRLYADCLFFLCKIFHGYNKYLTFPGISNYTRNAQPIEKLKAAYANFFSRSMRRLKSTEVCKLLHLFCPCLHFFAMDTENFPISRRMQWRIGTQLEALELYWPMENLVISIIVFFFLLIISLFSWLDCSTVLPLAGNRTTESFLLGSKKLKTDR